MNYQDSTVNTGHRTSSPASATLRHGFVVLRKLWIVAGAAIALQNALPSNAPGSELTYERLYDPTNVWTVHLSFAPEQWDAMEPEGGVGPFGGGPGGEMGPGGRGPGAPGAPGGGFSLSMLLVPTFLGQGDTDNDRQLSSIEFAALSRKWFAAWDSKHKGTLSGDDIRTGLNISAPFPGGPGGQGRAGGGVAPRPGMMLQGPEGKRNGLASAMGIEFVYVHADLEFEGRLLKDVGVRYKGNGTFMQSRGSLKRSLKVDLNRYVKGQKIAGVTMLNFQNNVTDNSWMNEVLAYQLYRDAGVPAPRTAYARVFVTVPGKFDRKYFGLYSMSENVDEHFAEHNFGTKRGSIFKPVTPSLFDDLGPDWASYNQTYDPKTDLYDEQKKAVIDLCRLVTHSDDAEFAARIGQCIDLPEFARFMAVMVYLSDLDGILGPGQNFYLHLHPKTQLFQFIPWDQDHSWGQFERASQQQRDHLSIHHPWEAEKRFLERIFALSAFKELYLAQLQEFSSTLFAPERIGAQVDTLAAAIRPAVQQEPESSLDRFDKAVAGQMLQGTGFGPFRGPGVKPIKAFAQVRTQSVLDQIAGRSKGELLGGFGFPGGFGGPPGAMPGGPGRSQNQPGPGGGFGIGMIFGEPLTRILDQNHDAAVTREEFEAGFSELFKKWNSDQDDFLDENELRSGVEKDLSPMPGGLPGFGPPPGGPGGPGIGSGSPDEQGRPRSAASPADR